MKVAALNLAARGFRVFPVAPNGKTPLVRDWPNAATRDTSKIETWWEQHPGANVGVLAGRFKDGALVVIDLDRKNGKDGVAAFEQLARDNGANIPETLSATTPSGGKHLFFVAAESYGNSAGALGPGIDVRGVGGYVVGSGSVIGEQRYAWDDPETPIAPCPGWLAALLKPRAPTAPRTVVASTDLDLEANVARAVEYLRTVAPLAVEGSGGDHTTYAVACRVKDLGVSEGACLDLLLERWNARCSPPWAADELAAKVRNAYAYGREPIGSATPEAQFAPIEPASFGAPVDEDKRPTISTNGAALHVLATNAERVLIQAGAPIYVRGARLVRPVVEEADASRGRRTKVARLSQIGTDAMLDHMSRTARWARYDSRKKKVVNTDPPRSVAAVVLSREGEWNFPRLAGVVTTPTLRPDGSLLNKPGYDEATRLLLVDTPDMAPIPEHPSKNEAAEALGLLGRLLLEVPFVDEASRAVALSALITPIVRGALPVVPLHAARAPAAGSSKSFLMDLASMIATGQLCPVISAGPDIAETEKRLVAAVVSGQPIISVDNVNGDLGGDALCQLVERPLVDVRPLGRTEQIRIESRATIFATGNNLAVVGDMVRRTLLCSLDANVERPELRQFERDPIGAVLADRGRYVRAALVIVRAYIAAGCPGELPALASFGQWSKFVRSALVWLGCADPVLTMETARAEDPESSELQTVVVAWLAAVGKNQPKTTGELIEIANRGPFGTDASVEATGREALAEAFASITGARGPLSAKTLAKWLSRHKGRVVNGVKLHATRDDHAKQNKWSLVCAAGIAGNRGYCSNSKNNFVTDILALRVKRIPANTRNTRKPPENEAAEIKFTGGQAANGDFESLL